MHHAYRRLSLDYSKQTCRIMRLLPGDCDEIHCTLDSVNLEDLGQSYACVSYVWGDTKVTRPIFVEGHELEVTRNLFDFLQHIRDPRDPVVLWVDAVCMNQEDAEEKSHQVRIMGAIYSRCSTVHVWLGSLQEPLEADPFGVITHFADGKHFHDLPGFFQDESGHWHFQTVHDFLILWKAFLHVAHSLWWTRAWTVQEIILPANSIMWCGKWKSTYKEISMARERHHDHLRTCCARSLLAFPNALRRGLDLFLGEVERIDRIYRCHHGGDQSTPASGPLEFAELALSFASRDCENPRDKVYSLLGLVQSRVFDDYVPDYHQTTAACYTAVFQRVLETDRRGYKVLVGNSFGMTMPQLPSWVRDFSHVYSQHLVGIEYRRLHVYDLFNCSDGRSGDFTIRNSSELDAIGVKADTIVALGPAIEYIQAGGDAIRLPLSQWTELCGQAIKSDDQSLIRKTLSRTICGTLNHDQKVVGDWRRHQDNDSPDETSWEAFINGDISALENAYEAAVELTTASRSFYITRNGNVGICNPGAQCGDEVWAVIGFRVPCVLRRVNRKGASGSSYYHFIGDCFLLDGMDGEIVRSNQSEMSIVIV